jgi:hypothetical protein
MTTTMLFAIASLLVAAAVALVAFGMIHAAVSREHPEELGDKWEDHR